MKRYAKALVAVAAVLAAVGKAASDGNISLNDAEVIVGAAVAAYGVYRVPNQAA